MLTSVEATEWRGFEDVLGMFATGLTHLRQPCLECGRTENKLLRREERKVYFETWMQSRVASLETSLRPRWPRVQWFEPRNDFGITGRPTNHAPPNAGGDLDHSDWTDGIPNLNSLRQRRPGNSGLFEMRGHLNCYLSNAMNFKSHSFAVAVTVNADVNVTYVTVPLLTLHY